ncbi:hypothetical protein [Ornithinimicrobium sp. INDO-MA30-4]|nr:hypothetical protein [Ornithinimicrobium sp. INDO-MA30-4]
MPLQGCQFIGVNGLDLLRCMAQDRAASSDRDVSVWVINQGRKDA